MNTKKFRRKIVSQTKERAEPRKTFFGGSARNRKLVKYIYMLDCDHMVTKMGMADSRKKNRKTMICEWCRYGEERQA